jgi:hypothetical protein
MAIAEACQLWIEQRVEEELEEGKSYRAIGRDIAKEIEKVFEAKVNPSTIERRAERFAKKGATNVAPQPTHEDHTENQENQVSDPLEHATPVVGSHGGSREGAGRSPKYKVNPETIVSEPFLAAYNEFANAIKNAKALKWRDTSKEAAIKHLSILYDIVTL